MLIRQLFSELRTAGSKHDRAALERIFADEYLWIDGTGIIENKARLIENILTVPPLSNSDALDLSSERFSIYGDIAILRVPSAGFYATTVFARKNGRWQFVQRQGTFLPPARKAVAVDPKTLDSFVGRYKFESGSVGSVVTNEAGGYLWWNALGDITAIEFFYYSSDVRRLARGHLLRLVPVGTDVFAAEDANAQFTFVRDDKQQVTGLVVRLPTFEESQATKLR